MTVTAQQKTREHKELERRWLVHEIDQSVFLTTPRYIEQAYMEGSSDLRVRISDGRTAEMTRKTGRGKKRKERNHELDVSAARFLMESTPYTLTKNRFVRDDWEIDKFTGTLTGIVLAEFEASSMTVLDAATLPPWIMRATEVTDSITNRHLARLAANLADGETVRMDQLTTRVPSIVLTGCPCSGKSSLMRSLATEYGQLLHCVPEVATIVINQVGATPPLDNAAQNRKYQRNIYQVQRAFEEVSHLHADRTSKRAMLLDRGSMDAAAYLAGGTPELEKIMRRPSSDECARYDAVLILAPAPREVFERDKGNNPARRETYEEAIALHARIMDAWKGHPSAVLVSGATWEEKVANARAAIDTLLRRL